MIYLDLQLKDLEADPELERKLRLRLNLPRETELVHYQPQQLPGSQKEEEEEQTSPLDLSQMLPVDAIIEVINEEVVGDDFPDLMEDHFLIYPGGVSCVLLTCGKYQVCLRFRLLCN